ncbi:MAG: phosphoglycerate dehydrogenase [Chloroflexi bacterium]|nr:phosphoglycerate dehydrogenase [Anaerolineaceae bacterium]NMB90767.1 phosphoglycerate dehydrogenase [Chloroflexota bacterium]
MENEGLKNYRVLVTATSYGHHDPRLKTRLEEAVGEVVYNTTGKPLTSQQLQTLLPGMDAYIAGLDEVDRPALLSTQRLKVISRYGVGVDNIDLATAAERGVAVTNTPGANSVSVAELAIGLMLSLARSIPEAVNVTRQGEWPRCSGVSLQGKTVGILGLGMIGRLLSRRLAGFDCQIVAYDPFPDEAFARQNGVELLPMQQVLAQADFLSLNMPLLPETRHLVNDEFLACMKPGAYLVNTARGEIIDEAALVRALQNGQLRGAALDAFCQEPPDAASTLLSLPQVLVTPHMGAHTDSAINAMGRMALEGCLAVLQGGVPQYRVV